MVMRNDVAAATHDLISVCVCTFKRQQLLTGLLAALDEQVEDATFCFDVIVVDNDMDRSAEPTVRSFAERGRLNVSYDCEPERNISLARNRAIRNTTGNLIAFIDDDERPAPDWLIHLHQTMKTHDAHGVLGPVIPDFPHGAPSWLRKGRVFRRRRLTTGARIAAEDARTGNALLR